MVPNVPDKDAIVIGADQNGHVGVSGAVLKENTVEIDMDRDLMRGG